MFIPFRFISCHHLISLHLHFMSVSLHAMSFIFVSFHYFILFYFFKTSFYFVSSHSIFICLSISRHVMSFLFVSCHFISFYFISSHSVSFYVHFPSFHFISFHVTLCPVVFALSIYFRALPGPVHAFRRGPGGGDSRAALAWRCVPGPRIRHSVAAPAPADVRPERLEFP